MNATTVVTGLCAAAASAWLASTCLLRKRKERRLRLLCHNVQKKHNIGSLLRVAVAMGVEEVVLVNKSANRKEFGTFGAFGTEKHAKFAHCYTIGEAKDYLTQDGFQLVGVEIVDDAKPVVDYFPLPGLWGFIRQPWRHDRICIVMGNEGQGLHQTVKDLCDWFIYIPQYSQGTASMNVVTAAAIIMHQFAMSRCSVEASRQGEKFVVNTPPTPLEAYEKSDPAAFDAIRNQRAQAKEVLPDEEDAPEAGWLDEE